MKIFILGFVICIVILLILQFIWIKRKLKRAIFINETSDLIILEDYSGKEIDKKIKINL